MLFLSEINSPQREQTLVRARASRERLTDRKSQSHNFHSSITCVRRLNTYTRSVRHELRPADCSSWPVNPTGSCSARNPALGNDGLWGKPAEVREFERLRPARAVSSEWVQSSCGIRCVSESPAWRHGRVSSAPAGVVFTEQTAIHRSISVKMWLNPHALLSVLKKKHQQLVIQTQHVLFIMLNFSMANK